MWKRLSSLSHGEAQRSGEARVLTWTRRSASEAVALTATREAAALTWTRRGGGVNLKRRGVNLDAAKRQR